MARTHEEEEGGGGVFTLIVVHVYACALYEMCAQQYSLSAERYKYVIKR